MEEFVENFLEFKGWLYDQQYNCVTPEQRNKMDKIIKRFEELNLHKAF